MLLDKRQIEFGTARVPEIEYSEKVDIKGYESILEEFEPLLKEKFCSDEIFGVKDELPKKCIEQTITFLKHIGALKPLPKPVSNITLWKEFVKMDPFYEGVNAQLKTTIIKNHFPSIHKAMNKGAVYSHYGLTTASECVLYIMEYFTKEKLFRPLDEIVNNKAVLKWVEDYNQYLIDNKERLEKEEQEREKYIKEQEKRMAEIDKELERLKNE